MKTLQNNYTTQEQSKRLLELGVPADSSDCYYFSQDSDVPLIRKGNGVPLFPCWSVGRLMEIFEICDNLPSFTRADMCSIPSLKRMSYMEYMMKCYNKAIEMGILDFSKLEE